MEVEDARGVNSKVHLSLCNSILDFGTCFEQVEHKTIEVLPGFFSVSSLLLPLPSFSPSSADSFEV